LAEGYAGNILCSLPVLNLSNVSSGRVALTEALLSV